MGVNLVPLLELVLYKAVVQVICCPNKALLTVFYSIKKISYLLTQNVIC